MHSLLDARPIIVAIAGPNGAGKTTIYNVFLRQSGLRFVNADEIARELGLESYRAAEVAGVLRAELVRQRESFIFETVFSDPVGEKVAFLGSAAESGYAVVLCFVGLSSPEISADRVAMRVLQGGHDVPDDKIRTRFLRTIANLGAAVRCLPLVLVFDNDDLNSPYRKVAEFECGASKFAASAVPAWLAGMF